MTSVRGFPLKCVMMIMIAAATLLTGRPAAAADPTGIWAMRASDTIIFVVEVRHTENGWSGTWQRPTQFSIEGDAITNVSGPAVSRVSSSGRPIEGGIELRFIDPRPGATDDIVEIRAVDEDQAEMRFAGLPIEPFMLERETKPSLGPWDRQRSYVRRVDRPTNSEMTAIFEADQAARMESAAIDWSILASEDRKRLNRTQQLLDSGALNSADDFYHASFIFQHGDTPADFLKAHLLATVAAARGKSAATWIAAATLDRYLMSIGQPQVLGTQFQTDQQGKTTQGNYDRSLLSDGLRKAMGVPTLAEQQKSLEALPRTAH